MNNKLKTQWLAILKLAVKRGWKPIKGGIRRIEPDFKTALVFNKLQKISKNEMVGFEYLSIPEILFDAAFLKALFGEEFENKDKCIHGIGTTSWVCRGEDLLHKFWQSPSAAIQFLAKELKI